MSKKVKQYNYNYKGISLSCDRPEVKYLIDRAAAEDTTVARIIYRLLRDEMNKSK